MIPIELICHELNRLTIDYYSCNDQHIKSLIESDIKLLSNALFLIGHMTMSYSECELVT
ncbi:hypothetical protein J2S14_003208 [Lederbergia wuyishanensis]|uniref:Uncharacterized protein n=1 Tax=Lederbergia wuyishanensis TaxID=1347903 RepID=A0ABU0D7L9_9BACI|nr:hypothetical protein [Lederbergia wuyishanensis]